MNFYADLHIHSKFSRATSRSCDLISLARWAQLKGLKVLGTGDFTHPGWREQLEEQLEQATPGLFQLKPTISRQLKGRVPSACQSDVMFCLSVEISTIYKKGDKTRKVHHLIVVPDFPTAKKLVDKLEKVGNLHSDGRPILGLDSRDLLEMVLESGDGAYLIPAHIWTPWFAMLGSKSGFDSVEECYGDLSEHIFALETGLSSDPAMNWRVSLLDKYRLVSNSDAHSPSKLAREACIFSCGLDYFSMMNALHDGEGYIGTVEFFPEEGKYHLDGHRKCNVRSYPVQTRSGEGLCPVCGKPLTRGVMYRVEQLADRTEKEALADPPKTAGQVRSLVPLVEVIGEILQVGSGSKRVQRSYHGLLESLGPELDLLWDADPEQLRRASSALLVEAITRLRAGRVRTEPGYDGEYGVVRLFEQGELGAKKDALLFPVSSAGEGGESVRTTQESHAERKMDEVGHSVQKGLGRKPDGKLLTLDGDQERAVRYTEGVLIVEAGPGSGKTTVLVQRLMFLLSGAHSRPQNILAITFTRRAAESVRQRLKKLLPDEGDGVQVMTLHSLGLMILEKNPLEAGLEQGFSVCDEQEQLMLLVEHMGLSIRKAKAVIGKISRLKVCPNEHTCEKDILLLEQYDQILARKKLVDFDDLIVKAVYLLNNNPRLAAYWRNKYTQISVDEAQDLDPMQENLISLVAGSDPNLCLIGDPDQSIYGFRGVKGGVLDRFYNRFAGASRIRLKHCYRSAATIVAGAVDMMNQADGKNRAIEAIVKSTELVGVHEASTDKAEAEFVVECIEQFIGGHSFFSIDSGRSTDGSEPDLSFADMAVLYRTEKQSQVFSKALDRSGIPYRVYSHARLMDFPAVRAIVRSLRKNPGSGDILRRIKLRRKSIMQANQELGDREMDQALDLVHDIATQCHDDTKAFCMQLLLESQDKKIDSRSQRVSLMTIHSSKGLEFPVVFLTGCEDGLIPLRFGSKLASDMDEERRLFYVGMTRAMGKLIISRARKRLLNARVRKLPPSPFLSDVKKELIAQMKSSPFKHHKEKKEQMRLL